MKLGAARAEERIESQGDALADIALSHRLHQAAHVIGSCLAETFDALANIVGFEQTMAINTDDDIASGLSDPKVHCCGGGKLRVVQQFDDRVSRTELPHDFPGAVFRSAIHHQNLHPVLRIVLVHHRLEALSDELLLVAYGDDDAYEGMIFTHCF